jgi:hypothetical protein
LKEYYQSDDNKRVTTIAKKCIVFTPENVQQFQRDTYACLQVIYSALKAANCKLRKLEDKAATWTLTLTVRVERTCHAMHARLTHS